MNNKYTRFLFGQFCLWIDAWIFMFYQFLGIITFTAIFYTGLYNILTEFGTWYNTKLLYWESLDK